MRGTRPFDRMPLGARTLAAVIAVAACTTFVVGATACGTPIADGVQPLDGASSRHPTTAGPSATAPASVDAPAVDAGDPVGSPPADLGGADTEADRRSASATTVQGVLDRYDRVVTDLHADPGVLLRPGDPLLARLSAVVLPGAVLGDDVRSQVLDRFQRGESIPVRDDERSYVHHVQTVDDSTVDRIEFSWCGWSPGVVSDVVTGLITDDSVSHGVGTGAVERTAGTWMLSSLDESGYDVLPAGTADPCPRSASGS